MPGPCPNGRPTEAAHREARCRDRERCTGAGCRVRRKPYVDQQAHVDQQAREANPIAH